MKPLAATVACLLVGGCSVSETNATLPQRVCGTTLANPQRWLKSLEAPNGGRNANTGPTTTDRRVAAEDCVRGNVYDLAASGLDEGRVVNAAHIECRPLETSYLNGYDQYARELAALKLSPPYKTKEVWEADAKRGLDEVAAAAFVEARAGQCWAHRTYMPLTYAKGA